MTLKLVIDGHCSSLIHLNLGTFYAKSQKLPTSLLSVPSASQAPHKVTVGEESRVNSTSVLTLQILIPSRSLEILQISIHLRLLSPFEKAPRGFSLQRKRGLIVYKRKPFASFLTTHPEPFVSKDLNLQYQGGSLQ